MDESVKKAYLDKQTELFASAIEEAYNQGYENAIKEFEKKGETPNVIVEDEVEYFDLDLPSGTRWALNNIEEKTYYEACKLNLPTADQFDELSKFVRFVECCFDEDRHWEIVTSHGNRIRVDKLHGCFWYSTDCADYNGDVPCREACYDGNMIKFSYENRFPGYEGKVLLVK